MTTNELAVRNLQRYLRTVSDDKNEFNTVLIDGIFDTQTRTALSEYQKSVGLPDTGIANKETWDTLFEDYLDVTEPKRTRKGLYLFPQKPSGYEVALGDTQTLVRIIQILLLELRLTYDIFENIVESGTYDSATEDAIKDFQRINGLPITGRVDERTYNRIVREYSNLYA